jgi:large subunit ribosomal protein L29
MKAEKISGLDAAELERSIQEAREQLFRFRFQMGMGQLEGLKKYRSLKKDRARMLTVQQARVIAGDPGPAPVKSKGKKK